ncbi:MAG TPA: archaeal heat shock protein Hsp20 [Candidatus Bathyarchaeia archaeon]|nr:archaeal heat shock protein Hsp20 [Candidatus Bathyarchaeia archaeon]
MSEDDFLSDWFKRGRRPLFGGWMDKWFSDFDEMFERMFEEMARGIPKDTTRERKLADGSTVKEFGPFVYGYSMTMGPDGKPVVQEFGNVKPSKKQGVFGFDQPALEPQETREPLVDVINENEQVRVIAELPGVEKGDIKTSVADDTLTIRVDSPKKYYKEVQLPTSVDQDSPKASYNNGVLEIVLRKQKPKAKGKEIHID